MDKTKILATEHDLKSWARLPYWSCHEAGQLSFGINPATCDIRTIDPQLWKERYLSLSRTFADNKVEPLPFLDWARRFGADLPKALADEIPRAKRKQIVGAANICIQTE